MHENFYFINETKYGDYEINQKQALQKMGFVSKPFDEEAWKQEEKDLYPQHFTEDEGLTEAGKKRLSQAKKNWKRYNNEMVQFTDKVRDLWYDILDKRLEKYDIKIDTPSNKFTQHYAFHEKKTKP